MISSWLGSYYFNFIGVLSGKDIWALLFFGIWKWQAFNFHFWNKLSFIQLSQTSIILLLLSLKYNIKICKIILFLSTIMKYILWEHLIP